MAVINIAPLSICSDLRVGLSLVINKFSLVSNKQWFDSLPMIEKLSQTTTWLQFNIWFLNDLGKGPSLPYLLWEIYHVVFPVIQSWNTIFKSQIILKSATCLTYES